MFFVLSTIICLQNISKYNKKNNTLNSNLNQRKHLLNIIIAIICFTVIYCTYKIKLIYCFMIYI